MASASVPTIAQLVQAVQALQLPATAKQASKWLEEFQSSPHAWAVADQCLTQKVNPQVSFFAARTMRYKIQSYFHELPTASHEQLRSSLVTQLQSFCVHAEAGTRIADLAIQMIPLKSWPNPVKDLVNILGGKGEYAPALLEVLKELPNEMDNRFMPTSHEDREKISHDLGFQGDDIFPFLEKCLTGLRGNLTVMTEMFLCLASWLKFGGQFTIRIAESPLLAAGFAAVESGNDDLMDASREAIIAAIKLSNNRFHPKLRSALFPRIMKLMPYFQRLMAASDEEGARDVARIFGYMADSYAQPVVFEILYPGQNGPERTAHVTAVMQLMLTLSSSNNLAIFNTCCYFWIYVTEEHCVVQGELPIWPEDQNKRACEDCVFKKVECTHVQYRKPDPYDTVRNNLGQHYLTFVGHMMQVIQCPAAQTGVLSDSDELMDFRERMFDNRREDQTGVMVDTIHYDYPMARAVAEHVWKLCTVPNAPWQVVEAGLFMIMTVIRFAEPGSTVAPAVAQAMVKLPATAHPQMRQTAVRLFGELAQWAARVPGAVAPLFAFLVQNLNNRPMLPTTLRSIEVMCKDRACRKQMGTQLGDIIKIVEHSAALGLERNDVMDMISSAARIIAALPREGAALTVTTGTAVLCTPLLQSVQTALASGNENAARGALEYLTCLFKSMNFARGDLKKREGGYFVPVLSEHPCWASGNQTWQAIKACIQKFPASAKIAEETSRCTKALFRSLDIYAAPLLGDAITQNMALYQTYHYASCLYIAGKLIGIFGDRPEYVQPFFQMLQTLTQATFQKLNGLETMKDNPELVEDFLNLLYEVLRTSPQMVFGSPLAAQTFQFGVVALSLRMSEANDRATDFLRAFVGSKRREEFSGWSQEVQGAVTAGLHRVIAAHGGACVFALMKGLAGGLPPEDRFINNMADVLWELHQYAPAQCAAWLRESLTKPELSGGRVTPAQKQKLCIAFEPKEGGTVVKIDEQKQVWFKRHLIGPFARLFHPVSAEDTESK